MRTGRKYRIPYLQLSIIFIGVSATIWFFYPGCMSGDVLYSWNEALVHQDRTYYDMQPPLVAYVWHLLNSLPVNPTPRYANFFLFSTLLFWTGIVLAAQQWINDKLFWLTFCLCAGFFPPVFAILSQAPLKDAILCAALVSAYGALVVAENSRSYLAFFFSVACMFLALGFRHNAVIAVVPLALWAGSVFCDQLLGVKGYFGKIGNRLAAGILIFALLALGFHFTNKALTKAPTFPVQGIFVFDLVGMSVKAEKIYLPKLFEDYERPPVPFYAVKGADIRENPLTLANLKKLYSPESNLNIYWYGEGKALRFLDNQDEFGELQGAWLAAIRENPAVYLQVRLEMLLHLFRIWPAHSWLYYCAFPEQSPRNDGIVSTTLPGYYVRHANSIEYKPVFYFVAVMIFVVVLIVGRRRFPRHLIFLAASGLLYAAAYVVIAPDSSFRFLYWLVVVCNLLVVNLSLFALDAIRNWRRLKSSVDHSLPGASGP